MSNADDELSESDRALMKALAEAIGTPRPPIDLVARSEGLLAWIDVDSDLAMLADEPVAEAAGTRGATSTSSTLEFVVDDGSCVIEVTPSDSGLRGQVLGIETSHIVVRTTDGVTRSLPVDDSGRFSLTEPPSGTMRLELEPNSETRRIHTDWFVV